MSACLKGEINMAIQSDNMEKARASTGEFRDILGAENFFLELHDHGIEAQHKCNRVLPTLAKEFGLGLVAANDVHFLERQHHDAHDVMICIGTGKMVHDERRMRYTPELYFKSADEMRALFPDHPSAITNTLEIAERCNLELEFNISKYPEYPVPEGKTREAYLRELCYKGLHERYGERADSELITRLDYELDVLEKTGFVSYFLIVWDFIHFAKQRGIPVGPGRGSAAGSMVAYVLGITDIDPLQFNLLFERFLNPERVSPPDIDIDFCRSAPRRGHRIRAAKIWRAPRFADHHLRHTGSEKRGARCRPRDRSELRRRRPDRENDSERVEHYARPGAEKTPELKKASRANRRRDNSGITRSCSKASRATPACTPPASSSATAILSEYVPLCRDSKGSGRHQQFAMGPLTISVC